MKTTTVNMSELRSKIQKMIKEEKAMLVKEAKPEAFQKLFNRLEPKEKLGIAKWIKSKYAKYIPPTVKETEVLDFLAKNPGKLPISPVELISMYKAMPMLKRGLDRLSDEDIEATGAALQTPDRTGVAPYEKGETTLAGIAGKLGGVSAVAIKKIEDAAKEKLRKLGPAAALAISNTDPDKLADIAAEFEDKFDEVADQAAEKYISLLKASKGDVDKFLQALKSVGIVASDGEIALLKDAELIAIGRLAELVQEGGEEKAKQLLIRDINRPEGDNIVKTFQNTIAKIFNPPGKRGPKKVS